MNQDRLNKVRELFDEASNLAVDKRESFLNQKCKDDPELKNEIFSLFNSLGNTKDFLEEPLTIVEQNKSDFVDPYIGKQIGNYIIDGEAGVGGMGIVYTGNRNDKEFEQKVAIKILKHGITSEYLLKRFQIERQTLANLQHQNIARLLDGGRTVDGLPYLVMEFIDGIPITECCNQKKLSIEAVSYTHLDVYKRQSQYHPYNSNRMCSRGTLNSENKFNTASSIMALQPQIRKVLFVESIVLF